MQRPKRCCLVLRKGLSYPTPLLGRRIICRVMSTTPFGHHRQYVRDIAMDGLGRPKEPQRLLWPSNPVWVPS